MRAAELIGALSLSADLAAGFASEKGLRTVLVATRLARLAHTDASAANEVAHTVFWVSALRFVGCTAFSVDAARLAAGDDISLRKTLVYADFDRPLDVVRRLVRDVTPEAPARERLHGLAGFVLDRDLTARFARTHCESAVFFARTLGMPDAVARGLDTTEERFDGKGPRGLSGEELPFAARVSDVADVLELFHWTGGAELATSVLAQRRGRALDPALVDLAIAELPELVVGLGEGSVWEAFLAAEPGAAAASEERIDQSCVALGRFADIKSLYTLAHSGRVAAIADAAAGHAGLSEEERAQLRRAAFVHDLGRVAVATGTWDKKTALNALERQRVRAHSQHTEAVLRAARLDALADVAGATHERGHGRGYHKGTAMESVPFLAKLLAAADVMAALGEARPHRPALTANDASKELRALVEAGALDARATQAVLSATGSSRGRKAAWPGGLSDREVEVVRLVAIGRTNKDIAELLGMSARTAQKHVMNVYEKLGLESRAGLALYAIEHGLLDDPH